MTEFTTKVTVDGKITIPISIRRTKNIKKGDFVTLVLKSQKRIEDDEKTDDEQQ